MTNELTAALYACRAILVKLQTLSDAPTSQIRTEGRLEHGTGSTGLRTRDSLDLPVKGDRYSTSKIPEGVRLNGTHTQAPDKTFSLYGHYSYRMQEAIDRSDATELLKLAACATRDYEVYVKLRPAYHENHDAAVTELLGMSGTPAVEASWRLGAPLAWIRRQRVLHGQDAQTGDEVRRDARMQKVIEMKRNGATTRIIAAEVGISTGQVSNLLNGRTSSHG